MNEANTEKRPTSAELKKQIDEATKAAKEQKVKVDLLNSGLPITAIADRINGNSTTDAPKAESKSQPAQGSETPPAQPATEKVAAPQESVELKEWAKKKGINWDTPDSVLLELRKKDQEFHRKQAERKREMGERPPVGQPPQGWTPAPTYQPAYQPVPQYPNYAPNQRQVIENLARQYNMLPEDFERFAQLNRDMTSTMLEQERQRHQRELEEMKKENIKNSEFRELSADPVFRRPEVAEEFHNVLEQMQESEPDSFENDPYAYRKAFDRALQNIGRRNLERSFDTTQDAGFQLPKNPPKPLGTGAGGGRDLNENGVTMNEFERMSVEDKRKYLDSLRLVQPKY